ncbi:hypothetical protein NPIL_590351 [Nephila pilipes]|uniref:Uncharacterized protein n=1 Tax=Nephila pilipes TaxID=299642 RepID=A0A8X6NPM8_NEPPI|nr:hypothetical protein NPIL_590351 [Nephila pilipes]
MKAWNIYSFLTFSKIPFFSDLGRKGIEIGALQFGCHLREEIRMSQPLSEQYTDWLNRDFRAGGSVKVVPEAMPYLRLVREHLRYSCQQSNQRECSGVMTKWSPFAVETPEILMFLRFICCVHGSEIIVLTLQLRISIDCRIVEQLSCFTIFSRLIFLTDICLF